MKQELDYSLEGKVPYPPRRQRHRGVAIEDILDLLEVEDAAKVTARVHSVHNAAVKLRRQEGKSTRRFMVRELKPGLVRVWRIQ